MCEVIFLKDSNSRGENMWVIFKIGEVDELFLNFYYFMRGISLYLRYIVNDII